MNTQGQKTKEEDFPNSNINDPLWKIVSNAFHSYTHEGAINWLVRQGFRIGKEDPSLIERVKELEEEVMKLKAKQPFLGWTNDKDILNQQREYWGAMNGIDALQSRIKELEAQRPTDADKQVEKLRRNIAHLMSWIGKEHPEDALRLMDEITQQKIDLNK